MTYGFYKQVGVWLAGYGAVACIILAVVAWLAYDMTRRVGSIHELRREITARSSLSEQGALLAAQAREAAQIMPALQALIPPTDRLIDFPKETALLARREGLEFGFVFGASVPGSETAPGTLAFSISGKGKAQSWLAFMRELQTGPYVVGVNALRMASPDGVQYETTINGTIFTE